MSFQHRLDAIVVIGNLPGALIALKLDFAAVAVRARPNSRNVGNVHEHLRRSYGVLGAVEFDEIQVISFKQNSATKEDHLS